MAKQIAENMCDIFDGGSFIGVVNAPDLGAVNKLPHIVPYVMLAERIGAMQSQLLGSNKVSAITIYLRGKDVADTKLTDVIKSAVLKGALGELSAESITYVNAISKAEELGLKVFVNISEATAVDSGYMNSILVEMEIEGFLNISRNVEGTVFGTNDMRITNIDGFSIDLPPSENILLFNNLDVPGVLRKVSQALASENVNIAHFSLGRKLESKKAMSALVLDTPASAELISNLGKHADISNVLQVRAPQIVLCTLFYFVF